MNSMLSRIADSLFWLNRYTERCDGLLRHVYVHYILSLDRSLNTNHQWRSVLQLYSASSPEVVEAIEDNTPGVLINLFLEEENANSVKSLVTRARENARGVQDHITKEVWEVVNSLYHQINNAALPAKLRSEQAIKTIDGFVKHTALYAGTTDNTMSRGLGWNFLNLGKFVERCMQTTVLLRKELDYHASGNALGNDILQWRYLLFCLSGYEMHLKTYRSDDHRYNALHQITLNENFPRSIIYSLIRINYYLDNIIEMHGDDKQEEKKALSHAIGHLHSKVRYMNLKGMDTPALRAFLQEIGTDLSSFTAQLGGAYFLYS